jgi:hypothetical protein
MARIVGDGQLLTAAQQGLAAAEELQGSSAHPERRDQVIDAVAKRSAAAGFREVYWD